LASQILLAPGDCPLAGPDPGHSGRYIARGPSNPFGDELWFGNLRYPEEQSQQYGRAPEIVREVNELGTGNSPLRAARRGFERCAGQGH